MIRIQPSSSYNNNNNNNRFPKINNSSNNAIKDNNNNKVVINNEYHHHRNHPQQQQLQQQQRRKKKKRSIKTIIVRNLIILTAIISLTIYCIMIKYSFQSFALSIEQEEEEEEIKRMTSLSSATTTTTIEKTKSISPIINLKTSRIISRRSSSISNNNNKRKHLVLINNNNKNNNNKLFSSKILLGQQQQHLINKSKFSDHQSEMIKQSTTTTTRVIKEKSKTNISSLLLLSSTIMNTGSVSNEQATMTTITDKKDITAVASKSMTSTVTRTMVQNQMKEFSLNENMKQGESILRTIGPETIRKYITAYIEPPLNDTIPGTGTQGDITKEKDHGIPPKFYSPLPLRTITPNDLQKVKYTQLQTCNDVPAKIPIDHGIQYDKETKLPLIKNTGDIPTPNNYPTLELPYCPVEADPFLPWIHDFFPSIDGTRIEFIAQNKRRCKTGKKFLKDIKRLEPQVSLFQSVSVQRINDTTAQQLAPELWHPRKQSTITKMNATKDTIEYINTSPLSPPPRYRLVPYKEASYDGMFTRFICRFHTTIFNQYSKTMNELIIGETLSTYPFNYDYISYRKGSNHLLTPRGKDTTLFWASTLLFSCPIPDPWKEAVVNGSTILSDGTPTLHVDIIPIRTSPRYEKSELYFTDDMWPKQREERKNYNKQSSKNTSTVIGFDASKRWGNRNVLPRVEASGRWANIPICHIPTVPGLTTSSTTTKKSNDINNKMSSILNHPNHEQEQYQKLEEERNQENLNDDVTVRTINRIEEDKTKQQRKPHLLSACLWASESFKTRGVDNPKRSVSDTKDRLVEWIEFHLMVGFDHIYVYDNSGAHSNTSSLIDITNQYPSDKVTRIDWPSLVCNNNIPRHDNTGERSSQYAAENSCRTRYSPYTEWIASFDTDEYLIPMGNYTNLRDVVLNAERENINILSFRSSRGRLRYDSSRHWNKGREMLPNVTYLEAYNCDSAPSPKPSWADRARKQIYRSDYVLYHFVHYSTVTQGYLETYGDFERKKDQRILQQQVYQELDNVKADNNNNNNNKRRGLIKKDQWISRYVERMERVTDEVNEAVMIHTKGADSKLTSNYMKRCHYQFEMKWRGCYIGFPWPKNITITSTTTTNNNITNNDTTTFNTTILLPLRNIQNTTTTTTTTDTDNSTTTKTTNTSNIPHDENGMEYNCYINEKVETYWLPRLQKALNVAAAKKQNVN